MIIISIDEGGQFEQLLHPQCMIIGGLAFQCETEQDVEQEKNSLKKFFQTVCAEQGASYPEDLHPRWDENGIVINAEQISKVKGALAEEMPDYLQKKGRWNKNRPAKGIYYTCCMVGDQHGLDDRAAGNLRDNIATVRYDHMIYRTIENLLLFNPRFQSEKTYALHLPTRVMNLNDRSITDRPLLEAQLKQLGYRRRRNEDGTFDNNVYEVTDETSFRTCLESALLNSDRSDLHFDLMIQSISYKSHQHHQLFLYLADTLCSVYQNAVYRARSISAALPALMECGQRLTGAERTLLLGYHNTDRKWRAIWKNYSYGNWFEALSSASEIHSSRSVIDKIYNDIWLKPFEQLFIKQQNFTALNEALSRLDLYMRDLEKRKQGTGLYVMNLLKENQQNLENERDRNKLEYQISKIMTGLYNHRGDYKKAEAEYEKCIAAARYVPIEEFLGLQLFHSVTMCDAQQFEKAEEIASRLVSHHELLNDIKTEVYPDNRTIYDSYARALSQHGQCLAFLGRHEEAAASFNKALSIFEKGSRDHTVTGSYLLHDLIEQNDQKAYTEAAKEYFGAASAKKQFGNIMNRKCGSIPFALYLFLKGLWVFRTKEDPVVILNIIDTTKDFYQTAEPGHPWEQILKYCAFLRRQYQANPTEAKTETESLMALSRESNPNPVGILKVIQEENEKQYALVLQGRDYTADSKVNYTYR